MELVGGTNPEDLLQRVQDILSSHDPVECHHLHFIPGLLDSLQGNVDGGPAQVKALSTLADASRNVEWREPFKRSGILQYALESLSSISMPHAQKSQLLRIIGNCCADNDEVRMVVLPYIDSIVAAIAAPETAKMAISALYNLCADFEPAEEALAKLEHANMLTTWLYDNGAWGEDAVVSCALELLTVAAERMTTNPEWAVPVGTETYLDGLLCLPSGLKDFESFTSALRIVFLFLANENIQTRIAQREELLQRALMLLSEIQLRRVHLGVDEDETIIYSEQMSGYLVAISGLDEFFQSQALDGAVLRILSGQLEERDDIQATCACLMLGNYARSDAVCVALVREAGIHVPAMDRLRQNIAVAITTTTSEVYHTGDASQATASGMSAPARAGLHPKRKLLHAFASLLRHLAMPTENKKLLGDAGLLDICLELATTNDRDLQHAAMSLLRQLVRDSHDNSRRLLERGLPDVLAIYAQDDPPLTEVNAVKIEIARVIVAILRCPYSEAEDQAAMLQSLYQHYGIARPLFYMTKHGNGPMFVAEGWFGLALMARSKEGAVRVMEALEDITAFSTLVKAATDGNAAVEHGPDGTGPQSKDRENALLLVGELLNHGTGMDLGRRAELEELFRSLRID